MAPGSPRPVSTHTCTECGKAFPTQHRLAGHIGGAHGVRIFGPQYGPDHIPHGTHRGYQQHRRYKVPPCPPCRRANAKYKREWRVLRKVWGPGSRP